MKMRKINPLLLITACFLVVMVNLTSCSVKGKENETDSISSADTVKVTSVEFLQKAGDNFFLKENIGKAYSISNCLVVKYGLSTTDNTNEIMLIAYDSTKNEVSQLMEALNSETFGGAFVGETKVNKSIENYSRPSFSAWLADSKEIQSLSFYNPSLTQSDNRTLNTRDLGNMPIIHFNDLVTITGTLDQESATNGFGDTIIIPCLKNSHIEKQNLPTKQTQNNVSADGIRSCLSGTWKQDNENDTSSLPPVISINFYNQNEFDLSDKERNTVDMNGVDSGYADPQNYTGTWELLESGKVELHLPNSDDGSKRYSGNYTFVIGNCSSFILNGKTFNKQ